MSRRVGARGGRRRASASPACGDPTPGNGPRRRSLPAQPGHAPATARPLHRTALPLTLLPAPIGALRHADQPAVSARRHLGPEAEQLEALVGPNRCSALRFQTRNSTRASPSAAFSSSISSSIARSRGLTPGLPPSTRSGLATLEKLPLPGRDRLLRRLATPSGLGHRHLPADDCENKPILVFNRENRRTCHGPLPSRGARH